MPAFRQQQVDINIQDIQRAIVRLQKKAPQRVEEVISEAVTETLNYGEKQIFKQITAAYDITEATIRGSRGFRLLKQAPIPGYMSLPAAWAKAGSAGRIVVQSSRLPVIKFNVIPANVPQQAGIPVSRRQIVSVMLGRNPRTGHVGKPNRFLARMSSGHLGVFMRKGVALNPGGQHRIRPDGQRTQLPIQEEFMISPSEMIGGKRVRPKLETSIPWFFVRSIYRIARTKGII